MIRIEYRDKKGSRDWLVSRMDWDREDIAFFNRVCGYEKYRARIVAL